MNNALKTVKFNFYFLVAIATTRYCGEIKHISIVVSVSSREGSLIFARSSVFPREELRCIIGLYQRHF